MESQPQNPENFHPCKQNVRPDLDPICLTLKWYSRNNFSKKLILKDKKQEEFSRKYTNLLSGISMLCSSFTSDRISFLESRTVIPLANIISTKNFEG